METDGIFQSDLNVGINKELKMTKWTLTLKEPC